MHGFVPGKLDYFQPMTDADDLNESTEDLIYWDGCSIGAEQLSIFEAVLLPLESWSPEAKMFGESGSDKVEIWSDYVLIKFDLRNFRIDFFEAFIKFGRLFDCVAVSGESAEVLELDEATILENMISSTAANFVTHPHETIKKFAEKHRERF